MKKIIVIIVLLALLIGGGVAAMAMLGMPPFDHLLAKTDKVEAPKPEPEAAAAPRALVYDVGSFIIPLVRKRSIARQIGMDLSVEVEPKAGSLVAGSMPKLQNAFMIELYDFVPNHSDVHSAADRQAIHDRLLKVASRVFGEGAVREVNVKSLYER